MGVGGQPMHETSLPIPPPQAIEAMYARQSRWQRERAAAFFSSELGGIVTDPALMLLHADELRTANEEHCQQDKQVKRDGERESDAVAAAARIVAKGHQRGPDRRAPAMSKARRERIMGRILAAAARL